jgi:hypothetical protein
MVDGGRIEQNPKNALKNVLSFVSDFEEVVPNSDQFFRQKFFTHNADFNRIFASLRQNMARNCTVLRPGPD